MLNSHGNAKINTYHLKLCAMISMLIDHVGVIIIYNLILAAETASGPLFLPGTTLQIATSLKTSLIATYAVMRAIGRFAFPLYCFLLVEGFYHTRSKQKYLIRLLLFAFISEIPYNLAFYNEWFHPVANNVFLTLILGFFMMWTITVSCEKIKTKGKLSSTILKGIVNLYICCFFMALSYWLHTDYKGSGIIAIWILFTMRKKPAIAIFLASLSMSIITRNPIQIVSILSVIPIIFYNGQKGPNGNRYIFYIFYPAHLVVLTASAYLLRII